MKPMISAAGLLLLAPQVFNAQTAPPALTTPHDRLVEATAHSRIDDLDLKPWHLKLDVTLFDAKGQNPITGTIESWHSDKNSKTTYIFGDSSRTILHNADNAYEGTSGPGIPGFADQVLEATLNPGPSVNEINTSQPDLRKEHVGKITLDCVMLSRPIKDVAKAPLGLFPTYCLDEGSTKLRATYNFGSQTVLRNSIGIFQGREIATHISLDEGPVRVADAKVTALAGFTPTSDFFEPNDSLKPIYGTYARVSGGVMAGAIQNKPTPVYPASAKQNHVSGTVILRALIGRDGHVHSLQPISGGDPDLVIAAIAAVRQWTYKPYLLNGFPTEVDTTITVNFNLNPF